MGLPSPAVVEYVAVAGYDFAVVDTEHGAISAETVEHMIRAGNAFGLDVVVRVGANDRAPIQVALDAGAAGVQIPMVESREQAERAVRFARYAPYGSRGLAGNRAAAYAPMNAELMADANSSVIVIAQIETVAGKAVAAEIAAVPGVDVVFVGPTDLSQSMGYPGAIESSEVNAAIDEIAAAAARDSILGTLARSPGSAGSFLERGFQVIEVAANSLILRALKDYIEPIRGLHGASVPLPELDASSSR
ncbi:aldolase/citrate lyase family protein [Microbacterium sp. LWH7-1.2]|uniref:HpcH/HpaI aldolase family protein n=1 Tax=Microbacterium sp. LWH7-1.2 TaxID=3135257 RepID=UPI003139E2D8